MKLDQQNSIVVLLHGLTRTSHSMSKLAEALEAEGYDVLNINYPSTKYPIEFLAERVAEEINAQTDGFDQVHFVTHSMGGILVRYIQRHFPVSNLGRVVMLSPPNHGSEIVDYLGRFKLFESINGPAGLQLGTGAESFVEQLGSFTGELGIITGDRTINLFLSLMIRGENDGKVSIKSAQLEGMKAFKVVHATHPMIMKKRKVIGMVVSFLETGDWEKSKTGKRK